MLTQPFHGQNDTRSAKLSRRTITNTHPVVSVSFQQNLSTYAHNGQRSRYVFDAKPHWLLRAINSCVDDTINNMVHKTGHIDNAASGVDTDEGVPKHTINNTVTCR